MINFLFGDKEYFKLCLFIHRDMESRFYLNKSKSFRIKECIWHILVRFYVMSRKKNTSDYSSHKHKYNTQMFFFNWLLANIYYKTIKHSHTFYTLHSFILQTCSTDITNLRRMLVLCEWNCKCSPKILCTRKNTWVRCTQDEYMTYLCKHEMQCMQWHTCI